MPPWPFPGASWWWWQTLLPSYIHPSTINTTLFKQCDLLYKWLGLKMRVIILVSCFVFIACCTLSTSNRTFLSQCTSFLFPSEVFYPAARGRRKEMRCKSVQSGIKAAYPTNPFGFFCVINYGKQIKTNSSGCWSKITLLLVQSKSHKKTSQYKVGIFESAAQIIRRLPLPTISADDASGGEETSITNRSSLAPPPWKRAYSAHPSLLKKCLMPSAGIIN